MEKDSDKLKLVMAQKEVTNLSKSISYTHILRQFGRGKSFQGLPFRPLIPGLYNYFRA